MGVWLLTAIEVFAEGGAKAGGDTLGDVNQDLIRLLSRSMAMLDPLSNFF
jgi:hypothetical protein